MFELKTYAPGEPIIAEGIEDAGLFVLQSGMVKVVKQGVEVSELSEPGTFFGEIAPILGIARSCSVIAGTECDILVLQETIDQIVENNPRLTRKLLNALAERVVAATAQLADSQHTLLAFRDHSGAIRN